MMNLEDAKKVIKDIIIQEEEKYNIEKVVEAIKKSATRMLVEFSEKEINSS